MKSTTNTAFHGEIYLFAQSLLWSLFPIISILAFTSLPPLYTAALSMLIAAIFFASILTIKKQWKEIKIKSAWKDILLVTFIIGVLFYTLIFIGLTKTTAGNASIIMQMELFFTMLILGLWKKENLSIKHKLGAILMFIGAMIILFPGELRINEGDLIILFASIIPPVGNYFAQKARKKVGSNMIMFVRSFLAGLFILALAITFETQPSSIEIKSSIAFLLINGILIFGLSKTLWLEAIHRISITKGLALNSITPAFTIILAFFILKEIPTIWQILGLIPIILGIFVLTEYKSKSSITGDDFQH